MSVQILGSRPTTIAGAFFGVGMVNYAGLNEYMASEHKDLSVGLLQGISTEQAAKIANVLAADLVGRRFDSYLVEFDCRQARLNTPTDCMTCEGMGLSEDCSRACRACRGTGFAPMSDRRFHRLTRHDVEAFVDFLRVCGGFRVEF